MAKCNCAGSSCGCSVTAGTGIRVTGTGTAANPFVITANIGSIAIADAVAVTNSTSIEFGKKGSGAVGDPVVLTGQVVVRSPNGTRWTPAVSDSGVGTWVPAGAAPTGAAGGTGGTTVVINDILYFDGQNWETRTNSAHALWISTGYTGVPIPPGFKKGDTWICEAS